MPDDNRLGYTHVNSSGPLVVRVDYTRTLPRCPDLTICHPCRARGVSKPAARTYKGYPLCQRCLQNQLREERRG